MNQWMLSTVTYTTKRITAAEFKASASIQQFVFRSAVKSNRIYKTNYNWSRFPFLQFIDKHYFCICFRDDQPVGFLMASLFTSFFDPNIFILEQNLLFSLPNTRGSYYLFKDFIDFGKANANHIISMIGSETNIKSKSLEKLGFKKIEELYRMET